MTIFSTQSHLSSTPRIALGSHQTAGSSPAPRGISPLAWFSRNRPHCLRRITSSERTSLVRFRPKAKSSLVSSLLLPQSFQLCGNPLQCFNARTLGWTGVSLSLLPVMADTGSHPVLAANCFSLPVMQIKPKTVISFVWWCLAVLHGRSSRSRCLGFDFRQRSRNVSDECVCGFQGAVRG